MKRAIALIAASAFVAFGLASAPAHAGNGGGVYLGFSPADTLNGIVYDSTPVTVAGTQKYLIAGGFTDAGSVGNDYITILNADGTVYPGFSPANTLNGAAGSAQPITISGEPKYLVTGMFQNVGAADNDYVTVLNADGSVYTGFSPGARITGVATTAVPVTVGGVAKYIVGGAFTNAGDSGNNNIVLLNANGTLDSSFTPGTTLNNTVRSIWPTTIDGTSKFLVGGNFDSAGGSNDGVVILNANGTVYTPFAPGDAIGGVAMSARPITIGGQPKYLVAGDFSDIGTASNDRLVIFNADGSVYTGFSPANNLNSTAYGVLPLALDGQLKYVVAGSFTNVGAAANDSLTMFNSDGSVYAGFTPGATLSFAALSVSAVSFAGQLRFLTGGLFQNAGAASNDFTTLINGPVITRPRAARQVRVVGAVRSPIFGARWATPLGTTVTQPVAYYRVTFQRVGRPRVIAVFRVPANRYLARVARARLVAGLPAGLHGFVARVTPINSAGAGPTMLGRFVAAR